ncbi:hypothetical protein Q3G72_033687 [Acer saccharum]|nr:hypothetical protein Q3G72_033687 [Acer saccharum]
MNNINASSSEIEIREMNSQDQIDSSHGAGDHSSDKAKDDDKELVSIKNGVLVACSVFAAFCLQAILSLPGDIKPEQLLSKPMNITVGQLQNLQSFLRSNVTCFFLSVMTIFLVTFASNFNYESSIGLISTMMGALMSAATFTFYYGLVLATNGRLAGDAFRVGFGGFCCVMVLTYIFVINKKSRSFIRKGWRKIRDSCA